MNARKKHCMMWCGPAKVVKVHGHDDPESKNTFYTLEFRGKMFDRGILNVDRFYGDPESETKIGIYDPQVNYLDFSIYKTGMFVGVIDNNLPKSKVYVAKIIELTDGHVKVQYYGTRSRNIKVAKFYPLLCVVTHNRGQRVVKYTVSDKVYKDAEFVYATFSIDDQSIELVLCVDLKFKPDSKQLTENSIRRIKETGRSLSYVTY